MSAIALTQTIDHVFLLTAGGSRTLGAGRGPVGTAALLHLRHPRLEQRERALLERAAGPAHAAAAVMVTHAQLQLHRRPQASTCLGSVGPGASGVVHVPRRGRGMLQRHLALRARGGGRPDLGHRVQMVATTLQLSTHSSHLRVHCL